MTIEAARAYVGTTPVSGAAQFALLVREGLRPDSELLEIGCGTLHLGKLLLAYLDERNYHAIEPNEWLVDEAIAHDPVLAALWGASHPALLVRDDFDASGHSSSFDFVFAHSVLSHAAAWQLPLLLGRVAAVLAPGGKLLASFRMGDDTNAPEWTYPSVTWFSRCTVAAAAADAGLFLAFLPETRKLYSSLCAAEIHDWFLAWPR